MDQITIVSLGKEITYDPEVVFVELLDANPRITALGLEGERTLHALVRHLYGKLKLSPYDPAGEILSVRSRRHVNTIIIQTWLRLKNR
jgi:hypothetical protein